MPTSALYLLLDPEARRFPPWLLLYSFQFVRLPVRSRESSSPGGETLLPNGVARHLLLRLRRRELRRDGASATRYVFYREDQETGHTAPRELLAGEGQAVASDEIPPAGFTPGEYRLLVQVTDQVTGEQIEERVRFVIEP